MGSLLNHQVLKIDKNNISFISRFMLFVTDEIEVKGIYNLNLIIIFMTGLGVTLEKIDFETRDLLEFGVIERKVEFRDGYGQVASDKTYACLSFKHRNGIISVGKYLSSDEARCIRDDISNFALSQQIVVIHRNNV